MLAWDVSIVHGVGPTAKLPDGWPAPFLFIENLVHVIHHYHGFSHLLFITPNLPLPLSTSIAICLILHSFHLALHFKHSTHTYKPTLFSGFYCQYKFAQALQNKNKNSCAGMFCMCNPSMAVYTVHQSTGNGF